MLSRVADALFWLSRYTERAENNARMLDVNLQLMLDAQLINSKNQQHWESIIFTLEDNELFKKHYPEITKDSVVEFITFDRRNPNSVYSCLALARENARTVREQMSIEMWEQINRMFLLFRSGEARPRVGNSSNSGNIWNAPTALLESWISNITSFCRQESRSAEMSIPSSGWLF